MGRKVVVLTVKEIKYLGEHLSLYKPNTEQIKFHNSDSKFRWLMGGNRSGKSYCNMMDLAMAVLNVHPTIQLPPNALVWACIESWEQVRDVLWVDYLEKFIPANQIANVTYGTNKVPNKIYLKNGNVIECKAFNQGRKIFQARSVDMIYCDEQCLRDFDGIFTELQARLMDKKGRLSWSMTPVVAQATLEERFTSLPDTDTALYLNLNDNRISRGGYIADEEIDVMIAEWPEEVQETRIKGHFAAFVGNVYKTFKRDVHVIESFLIPEDWEKYRGIDFGFTNPFVCLWVARDGDNNYFVYDEYYKAQETIDNHIRVIKKRSKKKKYIATFADPENAEGREQLRKAGLKTKTAQKSIQLGIEAVQTKLKVKGNGDPSLFIFSKCKHTVLEFGVYRYPVGTRNKDAPDHPVKVNDHCLDGLRYIIYTLEKPRKKGKAILITG